MILCNQVYYFFSNAYLFWESGERQRERERENPKQPAKPDAGLNIPNREIVTWAEIKSQMLHELSHLGAPVIKCFKTFWYFWQTSQNQILNEVFLTLN